MYCDGLESFAPQSSRVVSKHIIPFMYRTRTSQQRLGTGKGHWRPSYWLKILQFLLSYETPWLTYMTESNPPCSSQTWRLPAYIEKGEVNSEGRVPTASQSRRTSCINEWIPLKETKGLPVNSACIVTSDLHQLEGNKTVICEGD